jgi:hypothetical protein
MNSITHALTNARAAPARSQRTSPRSGWPLRCFFESDGRLGDRVDQDQTGLLLPELRSCLRPPFVIAKGKKRSTRKWIGGEDGVVQNHDLGLGQQRTALVALTGEDTSLANQVA